MIAWGFIVFSTIFSVLGQLTLKYEMGRIGQNSAASRRPLILQIALSPLVIVGLGIYGLGVISWLMAMSRLEVTFLYPFASLSYIGIILGSFFLFREHISRTRLMGIAIIVVGVLIIGFSASLPG